MTTTNTRWWQPLLGTLLILIGLPLALAGLFGAASAVLHLLGRDTLPQGPEAELATTLVTLAMLTPLCLLATGWVLRRPAGTLSSVAGRLRWRWLGRCLVFATIAVTLMTSTLLLLPGEDTTLAAFDPWFLLVLLLLVPLQAAGEEYLFRGWILRSFAVWARSPWPGIVVSTLLFGLAHGLGSPWAMADVIVFGLVTAVLTVRTGGLEAAIALHVVNNVVSFMLTYVTGSMDATSDPSAMVCLISMAGTVLYGLIIAFVTTDPARRRLRSRISDGIDALVAIL